MKTDENTVCVDVEYKVMTEDFIESALAEGIKVGTWTVNNPNIILDNYNLGVTMFTSDLLFAGKMLDSKVTIRSSDFMQGKIDFGYDNLIDSSQANRISYTGFKFPAKVGVKYFVKIYGNATTLGVLQVGVQTLNELAHIEAKRNNWKSIIPNYRHDSFWVNDLAVLTYDKNFLVGNNPPAWHAITMHYTSNVNILPSHIDKVEFYEVAWDNALNIW